MDTLDFIFLYMGIVGFILSIVSEIIIKIDDIMTDKKIDRYFNSIGCLLYTSFLSKENALYWIRRTVAENYQEIKNWIKQDVEAYIELSISAELITGEGIAFHTDWKNIFSVHSVVVVLHSCLLYTSRCV